MENEHYAGKLGEGTNENMPTRAHEKRQQR